MQYTRLERERESFAICCWLPVFCSHLKVNLPCVMRVCGALLCFPKNNSPVQICMYSVEEERWRDMLVGSKEQAERKWPKWNWKCVRKHHRLCLPQTFLCTATSHQCHHTHVMSISFVSHAMMNWLYNSRTLVLIVFVLLSLWPKIFCNVLAKC